MTIISAATHLTPKRPVQKKQNKLGPYNLLQTLGEGEFGKVKLGIHIETGQEVAIKLIKKEGAGSDTRINKVEREISVLKTLNHPYIVKLYNVVETEKYIGIILEYASGGELFEYILAHRYLKEKDAKRFFAQLISSVQYMHKRKIVHRDLKLENLLLDKNRNIIVTDFGFANQFASAADDMMATTCGSPCYAAPELVVNAGLYAGSAVDIWSCGVILYAMLCGFLPFDDDPSNPDSDNINQLYRYILSTNLMFPSHVGVDARDLLAKMLVPDPAKRCSLDYIVKHPWLESYRQFLKKDAAQLEMEALAASRLSIMPDMKSNVIVSSSASTSLPRKVTASGAHAASARKTHIPVTTRDRFAPVANDKYLVTNHKLNNAVTEKPLSATPKSPPSQKTSSFRHFSIGRSSATTNTVEKPIHATNVVKTSKVPNFITRKPIKKEEEATTNNDSAITVASVNAVADDIHPEKSLSSPQSDHHASALSSVGSIRRNQRRGADKFLSFFTGGRASHIPVVSQKHAEDEALAHGDQDINSTINVASAISTTNEGYHDTTEQVIQDDLAQDSAISSAIESSSNHVPLAEGDNQDDQKLLHSSSEASTLGGHSAHSVDVLPDNTSGATLEVSTQSTTATAATDGVNAVRSITSTITEDQEGEANASNGSQHDGTSSIISHCRQLPERERGSSISTASILSEQGANSSLHSNSFVSFKDAPRRTTPLIFNSQMAGSSSLALRHQQFNNGHVRIDTGSSIVSSSADGHVDSASVSSAGTNPQPEASNSTRLTAKYVVSNAMGDGGRKAMAAVRRSIYRKHKSQPPPPSAAATQQHQQAPNSQRNSAPVTERKEPLISFAKSRFEETNTSAPEQQQQQRHTTRNNSIMAASASEVTAKNKTGKKMMEWIKKKSHGKENKKEANAQVLTHKTTPTAAAAINKEPRPSAQLLTKSRHHTKKESKTPAAAAKMPHSSTSTKAAETAPSTTKTSKIPGSRNTRKTVVSILAPPSSSAQHKPLAAAETEAEKEELVVPEQSSIRRKNRALSGSETAIAELSKKQGTVDERIEIHQGAIDRKALTSQSPALVIKDIARILHILGIDTTLESPYILKCCRRKAKAFIAADLLKKSEAVDGQEQLEEEEDDMAIDVSSASSSGISTAAVVVRGQDPIYGDAAIDNGDEIRFVVEMCRFKNLPGLYIVDIRRVRGNAWAYKFLYHKLIDFLDLGKDSYMQSSK
ncbi:pkinase-domain-containing protein [Mucor ambiguus]|uniref:non-specific serine/threonine protein kinase n=1 Tax=Mucor ambiguus TaxID=91626 RepID=A0A0C9LUK9_9FUNG|nr:pkinase-domain-containing protein [Mucor ambiguus]